jgi:hypothetical protein
VRESRYLLPRPRADRRTASRLVARMAPLDSVLDIDGNRHVFDRLRALIESRRAISFVGAGASAGLYPLWPELGLVGSRNRGRAKCLTSQMRS